jgi:LDH2 family malate/lactate/ureidoglycolate dehydrogenase
MAVKPVRAILLATNDDVAATLAAAEPATPVAVMLNSSGETIQEISIRQAIPFGHKVAIRDILRGVPIIRYGYPIGVATADIKQGDHVHSHNMRSTLSPAPTSKEQAREVRTAEWVRRLVVELMRAGGARAEAADAMATAVTEAHLRGVETHGLRRLRPYVTRIRSGGVDARAQCTIEQRQALLMIDGRNAIGHYVAMDAAKAVSEAARQFGVAIALIRNSNHFGFAGYYATVIAEQGQIGIVTSNGQVCVAPEGATKAMLSNDPLAIAAPTGRNDAFLEMDLAMSVTSRANVVEAAKSRALLPSGWAQDSEGHATRDPAAALAGSLLAFGGGKGFALLVALEAVTGVLAGGAYADQVSSKEAAPNAPEGTAHTMIAIDLGNAIGGEAYARRLDDMLERLSKLPTGADAKTIRYPGERRWRLRRERLRDGIPLSSTELTDVLGLAKELGVRIT